MKLLILLEVMSRIILLRAPVFFKPLIAVILLMVDNLLALSSYWSRLSAKICVRGKDSKSTLF